MNCNFISLNKYMLSMNCIVIEDDIIQQQLILDYINRNHLLTLLGSFATCESALETINNNKVDILFLDVEMPNINGMDFLDQCNLNAKIHVVITSSNTKYAIEAFDKGVADFLVKPFAYARFSKAVDKVNTFKRKTKHHKNFMFIKSKGVLIKLMFTDINWIQSSAEYIIIHTNNKKHLVYSSMSTILNKLPSSFIRVHRSNIVSVDKIDKLDGNILEVAGEPVRVSKLYKDDLLTVLGV